MHKEPSCSPTSPLCCGLIWMRAGTCLDEVERGARDPAVQRSEQLPEVGQAGEGPRHAARHIRLIIASLCMCINTSEMPDKAATLPATACLPP
jgi:hypothetical protein